jgi:D-alanyl-D-alanine carboxypeptidase
VLLPDSRAATDLHPYFQPIVDEVLRRAPERGIYPFLTSTRRPYALQACYYAQGRLAPGQSATYQGYTVSISQHGAAVIAQCRDEQTRVSVSDWKRTVTNAQPMQSWHTLGFAADFAFRSSATARDARYDGALYRKLADLFAEVCPDVVWGGAWHFADPPHFEWHPGITLGEAAAGNLPVYPKQCHTCGAFRDSFRGETCAECQKRGVGPTAS